ncbi:MAG: hypothetical protein ACOY93_02520, partial [Bacillota bacterium]
MTRITQINTLTINKLVVPFINGAGAKHRTVVHPCDPVMTNTLGGWCGASAPAPSMNPLYYLIYCIYPCNHHGAVLRTSTTDEKGITHIFVMYLFYPCNPCNPWPSFSG